LNLQKKRYDNTPPRVTNLHTSAVCYTSDDPVSSSQSSSSAPQEGIIFSVIIPHKNIPGLLQRCLDSIPRRKDIQIIVVDDDSDEDKVDFSRFPCLEDEYVETYLTKESKGAGYARNIGLTHAKGEWLLFADADDFFTEGAFDHFFAACTLPHEVIYFKSESRFVGTCDLANRADALNDLVDACIARKKDAENAIRHRWSPPWAKMIRRKLIDRHDIRFDEVPVSNDVIFSLFSGHLAQSITAMNSIVYCVTMRRGSLTNRLTPDFLVMKYTVLLRYNEFLRRHNLRRYQSPLVVYYLLTSPRYGVGTFRRCVKLAYRYKMNPFMERMWQISYYISFLRDMKQRRGYKTKA
jgi:glycosyltransferase involved in cell wall biosynthesis